MSTSKEIASSTTIYYLAARKVYHYINSITTIFPTLPTLVKAEICASHKENLLTECRSLVYYLTRKKRNEVSKIPFRKVSLSFRCHYDGVAQWIERQFAELNVGGSSPLTVAFL